MMRGEQLLRKYVDDGLSPEERFELEKIALEDDFLADAWEGLQRIKRESAKKTLNRITDKLADQKSTKIIPLYRRAWPYIAAASVLLVALVTIYNPKSDLISPQNEVALTTDIIVDEEESNRRSNSQARATEKSDLTKQVKSERKTKVIPSTSESKNDNSTALAQVDLSTLAESKKPDPIHNSAPQKDNSTGERPLTADAQSDPEAFLEDELIPDRPSSIVEVNLADEEGSPTSEDVPSIAFSQSKLKGSVTTNTLIDTLSSSEDIALEEAVIMDEGAVHLGVKRSKQKNENIVGYYTAAKVVRDSLEARPLVGFQKYIDVLDENNTVKKEDMFMRGIKDGTILKVSFNVDDRGVPIDIVIENLSDGPIKDAVILQIKSSGPWSNSSGKTIYYDLPLHGQ